LEENDSQSDGEKLQFSHVYSTEMKLGLGLGGKVLSNQPTKNVKTCSVVFLSSESDG
jgi:hypothetical protein